MRVVVVGATGYVGQEVVRIAARHPQMTLEAVVSGHEADQPTAPYFGDDARIPPKFMDLETFLDTVPADVVFFCQAPKQAVGAIRRVVDRGMRVVDLSADFRYADLETYRAYYGEHPDPGLLDRAFSGYADDLGMRYPDRPILGNPGCYPTAFFTAVGPLVAAGYPLPYLIVDGKSGVTGAGRRPQARLLMAEMAENFEPYNEPGRHRHTGEMEAVTGGRVVFQPHLLPMARGLALTIYVTERVGQADDIRQIWREYYRHSPFVRILSGDLPRTARVRGTNRVELAVQEDARTGTVVLYAALDNLGKGAAGQAVQHVNQWMGDLPDLGL